MNRGGLDLDQTEFQTTDPVDLERTNVTDDFHQNHTTGPVQKDRVQGRQEMVRKHQGQDPPGHPLPFDVSSVFPSSFVENICIVYSPFDIFGKQGTLLSTSSFSHLCMYALVIIVPSSYSHNLRHSSHAACLFSLPI